MKPKKLKPRKITPEMQTGIDQIKKNQAAVREQMAAEKQAKTPIPIPQEAREKAKRIREATNKAWAERKPDWYKGIKVT